MQKSICHLFNEMDIMQNPKSEIFNLRQGKDVNNPKIIPAYHHFKTPGYYFMKNGKLTIIEQITEPSNVSKGTLRLRLKRRETSYTIRLETLVPKGLNQERNNF